MTVALPDLAATAALGARDRRRLRPAMRGAVRRSGRGKTTLARAILRRWA